MALDLDIYQLVASNLPTGFVVSEDYVDQRLKYWQLFLRDGAEIPPEDTYDMGAWEALPEGDKWLILLSYCIVYDTYLKILSGAFFLIGREENGEEGEGGQIKKIVTGPTEVEYHDSSKALSEIIKALRGPGGLFDEFLRLACAFANQLGISLPFCESFYRAQIIIGKRPLRGEAYFNYIIKKSTRRTPKSRG